MKDLGVSQIFWRYFSFWLWYFKNAGRCGYYSLVHEANFHAFANVSGYGLSVCSLLQ